MGTVWNFFWLPQETGVQLMEISVRFPKIALSKMGSKGWLWKALTALLPGAVTPSYTASGLLLTLKILKILIHHRQHPAQHQLPVKFRKTNPSCADGAELCLSYYHLLGTWLPTGILWSWKGTTQLLLQPPTWTGIYWNCCYWERKAR